MLDVHGSLPTPDDIRQRSKKDTRYLLPDAQFRYERSLEPPAPDEGFTFVEVRAFVREPVSGAGPARALILDFDDPQTDPRFRARVRGTTWRSARAVDRSGCVGRGPNDGRAHRCALRAVRGCGLASLADEGLA